VLSLSVGLLASLPNITVKSRLPCAEILHGLSGQIEGAAPTLGIADEVIEQSIRDVGFLAQPAGKRRAEHFRSADQVQGGLGSTK